MQIEAFLLGGQCGEHGSGDIAHIGFIHCESLVSAWRSDDTEHRVVHFCFINNIFCFGNGAYADIVCMLVPNTGTVLVGTVLWSFIFMGHFERPPFSFFAVAYLRPFSCIVKLVVPIAVFLSEYAAVQFAIECLVYVTSFPMEYLICWVIPCTYYK